MTLQQLRYVVEISRCGSITAAAQRLFIAQPSLSKAVRAYSAQMRARLMMTVIALCIVVSETYS